MQNRHAIGGSCSCGRLRDFYALVDFDPGYKRQLQPSWCFTWNGKHNNYLAIARLLKRFTIEIKQLQTCVDLDCRQVVKRELEEAFRLRRKIGKLLEVDFKGCSRCGKKQCEHRWNLSAHCGCRSPLLCTCRSGPLKYATEICQPVLPQEDQAFALLSWTKQRQWCKNAFLEVSNAMGGLWLWTRNSAHVARERDKICAIKKAFPIANYGGGRVIYYGFIPYTKKSYVGKTEESFSARIFGHWRKGLSDLLEVDSKFTSELKEFGPADTYFPNTDANEDAKLREIVRTFCPEAGDNYGGGGRRVKEEAKKEASRESEKFVESLAKKTKVMSKELTKWKMEDFTFQNARRASNDFEKGKKGRSKWTKDGEKWLRDRLVVGEIDKRSHACFAICRKAYKQRLEQYINETELQHVPSLKAYGRRPVEHGGAGEKFFDRSWEDQPGVRLPCERSHRFGNLFLLVKKKHFVKREQKIAIRPVVSYAQHRYRRIYNLAAKSLAAVSARLHPRETTTVPAMLEKIAQFNDHQRQSGGLKRFTRCKYRDVENMFGAIPTDSIQEAIRLSEVMHTLSEDFYGEEVKLLQGTEGEHFGMVVGRTVEGGVAAEKKKADDDKLVGAHTFGVKQFTQACGAFLRCVDFANTEGRKQSLVKQFYECRANLHRLGYKPKQVAKAWREAFCRLNFLERRRFPLLKIRLW
eukprot:g10009.t1